MTSPPLRESSSGLATNKTIFRPRVGPIVLTGMSASIPSRWILSWNSGAGVRRTLGLAASTSGIGPSPDLIREENQFAKLAVRSRCRDQGWRVDDLSGKPCNSSRGRASISRLRIRGALTRFDDAREEHYADVSGAGACKLSSHPVGPFGRLWNRARFRNS